MLNLKAKERDYNLDLLRILASFMVIIIHVASYQWYSTKVNSFNWGVYNFYDSLVRCAVPIFIMISGVFFLSNKKNTNIKSLYSKNIFKLVIIFLFWSLIYTLYGVFINKTIPLNKSQILTSFIQGPFHFWYLPTILTLYLLSPILKQITKQKNEKLFHYFILLFFASCTFRTISCCTFIPYINYFKILIKGIPLDMICQYFSYFLFGSFLYQDTTLEKHRKKFYLAGILSVLSCTFLSYFISVLEMKPNGCFYSSFSIFTLLEATALFLFFKHLNLPDKAHLYNWIKKISSTTLGIYILHVMILDSFFRITHLDVTSINPIFSIPIIGLFIYVITSLLIFFAQKINFIKKYLL